MKQIAILKYTIMFDPSETWSNGYQFENRLADYFKYYGFEASIVEAKGGSGERVVYLERMNPLEKPQKAPERQGKPVTEQIKRVQQAAPPRTFKSFQERGVPKSLVNQEKRSPRTSFHIGRSNRMKVRVP